MLKELIVASAMIAAGPAIAKDRSVTDSRDNTASAATAASSSAARGGAKNGDAAAKKDGPAQSAATPSTATPGAPKATPPAQSADAAKPDTAPDKAADSSAAPVSKKQAPADEVASIVGREFVVYDVNHNGVLDKAEFCAWMTALKTRAPGASVADAPSEKWKTAAFTWADPDKSSTVTMGELLAFFNGTHAPSGD